MDTKATTIKQTPKFNCNKMDGVVVVTMNIEMVRSLLSLMREFEDGELSVAEFTMLKKLEFLSK